MSFFTKAFSVAIVALFTSDFLCSNAIPVSPHLFTEVIPLDCGGGTTGLLRAKGGAQNHVIETYDGYTTTKSKQGCLVFAKLDGDGDLEASCDIVGKVDPNKMGYKKGIRRSKKMQKQKCDQDAICTSMTNDNNNRLLSLTPNERAILRFAKVGTLPNLVIPIMFADHVDRIVPTREDLDVLMNKVGGDPDLAPTGSVKDVYLTNSYGQLTVESTVVNWVTIDYTEKYCADGKHGFTAATHICIKNALMKLNEAGFDFKSFDIKENDGAGDGNIDAIAILHSGYGAEWCESDMYGADYVDRMWSHQSYLYSDSFVSTDGVSVYSYHISSAIWGTSGSKVGRVAVIAHETGHFLGLPDLMQAESGSGLGSFCLMSNPWGFDNSQYYPPLMSAWSKEFLGWVSPTTISENGYFTLNPSAEAPEAFRIDRGFGPGEYLLVENRQSMSLDSKIPKGGIIIYHIDNGVRANDHAGFPKEGSTWPINGDHYKVAILQPDGHYNLEKGENFGDKGDVFSPEINGWNGIGHEGVIVSGDNIVSSEYPNTDAYYNGIVTFTGVAILNIKYDGEEHSGRMSFDVEVKEK